MCGETVWGGGGGGTDDYNHIQWGLDQYVIILQILRYLDLKRAHTFTGRVHIHLFKGSRMSSCRELKCFLELHRYMMSKNKSSFNTLLYRHKNINISIPIH